MKEQNYRHFSDDENKVWKTLFENLKKCRDWMAAPIFSSGILILGIDSEAVPRIDQVNKRLKIVTGWSGVPVEGLEDNSSFFRGLAEKKFPIGNFIRSADDVNYTPAPDVFHDLYGHLPFLADPDYANFCKKFGEYAMQYAANPLAMELWGRLFWFGVEFPLVKSLTGPRIFGGGILSSVGESEYALSSKPNVIPFDLKVIVNKSYKIDEFQKDIFILDSPNQLYSCLPEFDRLVREKITM